VTVNAEYLAELTELLNVAQQDLGPNRSITYRNVFGAVGGYVDGTIFVSCGAFGVALRLGPETLATLFTEDGVEPLRYFPKGHIKKEYAVLPRRILEDREQIRTLIEHSVEFVTDG
jgi:TfoX/Sxy family transcriptional regulator of competence genes